MSSTGAVSGTSIYGGYWGGDDIAGAHLDQVQEILKGNAISAGDEINLRFLMVQIENVLRQFFREYQYAYTQESYEQAKETADIHAKNADKLSDTADEVMNKALTMAIVQGVVGGIAGIVSLGSTLSSLNDMGSAASLTARVKGADAFEAPSGLPAGAGDGLDIDIAPATAIKSADELDVDMAPAVGKSGDELDIAVAAPAPKAMDSDAGGDGLEIDVAPRRQDAGDAGARNDDANEIDDSDLNLDGVITRDGVEPAAGDDANAFAAVDEIDVTVAPKAADAKSEAAGDDKKSFFDRFKSEDQKYLDDEYARLRAEAGKDPSAMTPAERARALDLAKYKYDTAQIKAQSWPTVSRLFLNVVESWGSYVNSEISAKQLNVQAFQEDSAASLSTLEARRQMTEQWVKASQSANQDSIARQQRLNDEARSFSGSLRNLV